jgi:hypothetical protein
MQWLDFGRIEDLQVRASEPVFEPAPRFVQKLKMGGEKGSRPEKTIDDFVLKHQIIEMFEELSRIECGEVLSIEVRHGLPFSMEIEQRPTRVGQCRHV